MKSRKDILLNSQTRAIEQWTNQVNKTTVLLEIYQLKLNTAKKIQQLYLKLKEIK